MSTNIFFLEKDWAHFFQSNYFPMFIIIFDTFFKTTVKVLKKCLGWAENITRHPLNFFVTPCRSFSVNVNIVLFACLYVSLDFSQIRKLDT